MSPMDRDRYLRELAATVQGLQEQIRDLHQGIGLGNSSFNGGGITQYSPDGSLPMARYGQQYDGTNGSVTLSGPPPPRPAAGTVEPLAGALAITWGGNWDPETDDDGRPIVAPLDLSHVEVHLSKDPTAFSGMLFETKMGPDITSARGGRVMVPVSLGDWYVRLIARSNTGKVSEASEIVGPFRPLQLTVADIPDIDTITGNKVFWRVQGDALPEDASSGDLLLTQTDAGPPPEYITSRFDGEDWVALQDQGVGQSLAAALAAMEAQKDKLQVVTQNDQPGPYGADDRVLWIDPGEGHRMQTWNGTGWEDHRLGTGAIEPGSLIARDVLATGTVSAALLEAVLVIASLFVAGDPDGTRVTFGPDGIQMVELDGGTERIVFNLGVGGDAFFAGVLSGRSANYTEGESGWLLDSDGDAVLQSVQVRESVTARRVDTTELYVAGRAFNETLLERGGGLVGQGFETSQSLQGRIFEEGIVELGFTAMPGRGYRIEVNGPVYASSDVNTGVRFYMRRTLDGTAPTVNSPILANPFIDELAGPNAAGEWPSRIAQGAFLWYPVVSQPTTVRLLLSFSRSAGQGTVGINCQAFRCQMAVYDSGPALPNSIRINNSKVSAPPPPPPAPVQAYSETFYTTWTASYRANNSRWSENDRLYQGNGDSFNGNQGSLMGFDLAYIRGKLSGATIKSAVLYARNMHTWNNSGGTIWIGTHGYEGGMPTAWNIAPPFERRGSATHAKGGWVGVDVTIAMNELRNGGASGFVIGRAPDNNNANYGYYYGQNYEDKPRVVVNWEK